MNKSILEKLNETWQVIDIDGWGYFHNPNISSIIKFKSDFHDDLVKFINKWTKKSQIFCKNLNCENSPISASIFE